MNKIGTFVLDSLQIFFPWDDDFYTYMKDRGFGKSGLGSKTIPLIYSDNTESTTGQKERQRKYVIRPELFGKTYKQLGWKETKSKGEPIIKAEKPEVEVLLDKDKIIFKIIPKTEYHMEYSSMAAFGKMYSNWAAMYLPLEEAKKLLKLLEKKIGKIDGPKLEIKKELKQNQREEIDYIDLPIEYYEFSLGEFSNAKEFFKLNGFKDKNIPSLMFDPKDKKAATIMSPVAKIGVLHTKVEHGFDARNPQFVIKITQDKITTSKRGKKAKVKGIIKLTGNENKILIYSKTFFYALLALINGLD